MRLPPELSAAIQQEIENVNRSELAQASAELTRRYKAARFSSPTIQTEAQRAAYLAVRVPATFAANLRVFQEIRRLAGDAAIKSVLDLGAGPGTAVYAANEIFPSLEQATMVEADPQLVALGTRMTARSSHSTLRNTNWIQQDISVFNKGQHDLVVISYALGELSQAAAEDVVARAWESTKKFLAIIEPGTMRGFGFIFRARNLLIGAGAHILAPCPHALECPMAAAGDWCHFAERLERTTIHRQLKTGELGYEDEKFSYLVASRCSLASAAARIVRHPQKRGRHVQLTLCTPEGLKSRTIGKSQKSSYKQARNAEWGDAWDF
ncbi:MAG TPA: small ribosomal subunit Rsm22 family protein [Candidatus Angelobacter sp.]|nr:small ribosomal subunit Rsm22 family protein [Candidatus Angelobacter sp.]